jgi:hypothetical protein
MLRHATPATLTMAVLALTTSAATPFQWSDFTPVFF